MHPKFGGHSKTQSFEGFIEKQFQFYRVFNANKFRPHYKF